MMVGRAGSLDDVAADAVVGQGCPDAVDPRGRAPLDDAVIVERAGPAVPEEVGVVVAAEQGEVVEVGGAAVDPGGDVVPYSFLNSWNLLPSTSRAITSWTS